MSAELLREAAKVLRERVTAVQSGAAEPEMWFGVEELELALTHGDQAEMGDPHADAAYIATMHPGVGLALADWLEATESTMRHVMDDLAAIEGRPTIDQLVGYDFVEAITVARLILGREAPS